MIKRKAVNRITFLLTILSAVVISNLTAQFAGGTGTEQNPWQIETADHLNNVRNYLDDEHEDKFFLQIADINLGAAPWNEDEGWIPIGYDRVGFYGSYDGNNHIIDGLYINRPDDDYQGLFGLTKNARITNLGLTNADVTGNTIVGALVGIQGSNVGDNNGIIDGCYATGSVTGSWIIGGLAGESYDPIYNSHSTASVTGSRSWIGGLVGTSTNTISNCYATGDVSGSENSWQVGGLIGQQVRGRVENSYAQGDVTGSAWCGGFAGSGIEVINCYATGNVTGLPVNDYSYHIGGLMGSGDERVEKSFATGNVRGGGNVGGLVGSTSANFIVRNCYATGSVLSSLGYNFSHSMGGLVGSNRGEVINSYSIGVVAGYEDVGGLIGDDMSDDNSVVNSYWNTETSGQAQSAGGNGAIPRTTDQMTYPYAANTYLNWDFQEIWNADIDYSFNNGYPHFGIDESVPPTATDTQTVNPGDDVATDEFEGTYMTLVFGNVDEGGDVTVNYYNTSPEDAVFERSGPESVSNYYWKVYDDGVITFTDGWVHLAASRLSGVNVELLHDGEQTLEEGILIYRRSGIGHSFIALPTYYNIQPALPGMLSVPIGNSFSEFVIGSNSEAQTLPVELSSFTANVTVNGMVELQWITVTETNMLGFNLYRGDMDCVTEAVKINAGIIPAQNSSVPSIYTFIDKNTDTGATYYYWLQAVDLDLTEKIHGYVVVSIEDKDDQDIPSTLITALHGNYPNPFNPQTTIRFSLKEETNVELKIYNIRGMLIRNLYEGKLAEGNYDTIWDGRDERGSFVSSGVYFYRLVTDSYDKTLKMLLLK